MEGKGEGETDRREEKKKSDKPEEGEMSEGMVDEEKDRVCTSSLYFSSGVASSCSIVNSSLKNLPSSCTHTHTTNTATETRKQP